MLDEAGATQDEPYEITLPDSDYGIKREIAGLHYTVRYLFTGYAPLLHKRPIPDYSRRALKGSVSVD